MDKITIFYKGPNSPICEMTIDNTLEAMQELCRGYIEVIRLTNQVAIIVNKYGCVNDMPYNTTVFHIQLFGPFFFVGTAGEEFTSITDVIDLDFLTTIEPQLLRN